MCRLPFSLIWLWTDPYETRQEALNFLAAQGVDANSESEIEYAKKRLDKLWRDATEKEAREAAQVKPVLLGMRRGTIGKKGTLAIWHMLADSKRRVFS